MANFITPDRIDKFLERAIDPTSQSENLIEGFHKTATVPVILYQSDETKRFCLLSNQDSSPACL